MQRVFQAMLIVASVAATTFQSFSQTKAPTNLNGKAMNAEQVANKQIIRNLYENILNHRAWGLLNDVIDSSYTGIHGEKGAEGIKQTVAPVINAFPDIQWHIEDLLADGNKVIVRWKWTGTFRNAFRGIPANQKQFTNEAIVIYELKNNKAVKSWMQSDQLGFMIQADVISLSQILGTPAKK